MLCSLSCHWMLWSELGQAPKLQHGEQGSEQRELVWWVFLGVEWESATTYEVP